MSHFTLPLTFVISVKLFVQLRRVAIGLHLAMLCPRMPKSFTPNNLKNNYPHKNLHKKKYIYMLNNIFKFLQTDINGAVLQTPTLLRE